MAAKLDYQWHLRKVMADRGMFSTTDLLPPLAERGITLSSSQVYRLVVERPERLSLKILMPCSTSWTAPWTTSSSPSLWPGPRGSRRRPPPAAAGNPRKGSADCGRSGPGTGVSTGRDHR
ncbi:helix-turn-helix domain-containing protein [Kitasatospora sp. NPDC091257]|uniref:helix-turn-helix domain-containing protein n=1 Tax=Kitasatospora sp. NPDC091257 TaxID=3364084 RepID=UPI0038179086